MHLYSSWPHKLLSVTKHDELMLLVSIKNNRNKSLKKKKRTKHTSKICASCTSLFENMACIQWTACFAWWGVPLFAFWCKIGISVLWTLNKILQNVICNLQKIKLFINTNLSSPSYKSIISLKLRLWTKEKSRMELYLVINICWTSDRTHLSKKSPRREGRRNQTWKKTTVKIRLFRNPKVRWGEPDKIS